MLSGGGIGRRERPSLDCPRPSWRPIRWRQVRRSGTRRPSGGRRGRWRTSANVPQNDVGSSQIEVPAALGDASLHFPRSGLCWAPLRQRARFYAKPLAALITARGRDALQTAITVVQQARALLGGVAVLRGDTRGASNDCVCVFCPCEAARWMPGAAGWR